MTALETIPFILFLAVIGTSIAERINVPYPLVLVVTGLLAGFIPFIPNWHPPSNVVLVIFLPPILFAAARLFSWQDIKYNLVEIVTLSIVLVIVSTLVIGKVLSAIVPGMSLSVGLVLAAIISPTDSIAATSILSKMNTQQHVIRSLEVESLFNDAVSIVLYNLAVSFVFFNTISFSSSTYYHVLIIGFGGIIVGVIFSFFTSIIVKGFLTDSENELPIIMSLILAYVAYLFAERIGVSGVLAVVAAGLFHRRTEHAIKARTRLSEKAFWDTYIYFLNGLIFIVIGLQFPLYLRKIEYIPTSNLLLFSASIILALLILRFIWVVLTVYVNHLLEYTRKNKRPEAKFSWRLVFISSWSGMRGLVSLALAIALPVSLTDVNPFPFRDLIIFLTIIVILFTLVVEGLTLPFLVRWLRYEKSDVSLLKQTNKIYRKLTKQAIEHISTLDTEEKLSSPEAAKIVQNYYANRLLRFKLSTESESDPQQIGDDAEKLLARILDYERKELRTLLNNDKISEEIFIRILHKIDRDEVGFASYK